MRSGEVRSLKLESLDWAKNLISLPRTKGRRIQCYPLVERLGRPSSVTWKTDVQIVEYRELSYSGGADPAFERQFRLDHCCQTTPALDFRLDSMARTPFATPALLACWRKACR